MKFRLTLAPLLLAMLFICSCSKEEDSNHSDNNAKAPNVRILEIDEISFFSANISGGVINDGGSKITEVGICWSLEPNPTLSDHSKKTASVEEEFNIKIETLEPNTKYYVRAYAVNDEATGYGSEKEFTTLQATAVVVTNEPVKIYETEVTARGEVLQKGNSEVNSRGFCWSTDPEPTLNDTYIESGEGVGIFEEKITGLNANTKYYIRTYATNEYDTAYGESREFVTLTQQVAYEGDVILRTQSEVEAFGASEYTTINGNLLIGYEGNQESDITDLSALEDLRQITGDFTINRNTSLQNSEGLGSLRSVGGTMSIRFNHSLSDLSALAMLTEVGSLIINRNDQLVNLDGLESLEVIQDRFYLDGTSLVQVNALSSLDRIGGDIRIGSNSNLESIEALQGLTEVTGDLILETNEQLTSLQGLNKIENIKGKLTLFRLNQIIDLSGLSSLVSVEGEISISWNENLISLHGLEGLTILSGSTEISQNSSLENLEGFNNLSATESNFYIKDNSALTSLEALSSLTLVGGEFRIHNNAQMVTLIGLENLKEILFSLYVTENDLLRDFNGLHQLESVGGRLVISTNANLETFNGLEKLSHMGGDLYIGSNYKLQHINALTRLTALPGGLTITNNAELNDLSGLSKIRTCKGMYISQLRKLTTLEGFQSLEEVTNNITINYNQELSDFCALETALNNGFNYNFSASSNAYNPTLTEVQTGNCKP